MRLLILVLPLFLLMNSCVDPIQQEYEKNVKIISSKAWKYESESIREAAKSTLKSNKEEDLMNNALERLEGASFNFNEDGSMLLDMTNQQLPGNWELSKDSKEFYILIGGASNFPNPVVEILPDRITLGADYEKGIIFPKIFVPVETNGE